jgi:hypothetical protein
MRMARAFMASVPLALVLVAALVVPLAVTPGTFGFHSWPTSHGEQVTDRPVRAAAPSVQVAESRPARRPAAGRRSLAVVKQQPGHTAADRVPATATPAAPRRQAASVVSTPSRGDQAEGNGPGRPDASTPPPAPQTPASEGEPAPQPATDEPAPQLAGGETPVLRDDQPEAPAVPSSPVQPVIVVPAPAPPADPSPPPPSDGSGDHRGHGPLGPLGDLLPGSGHGHGRHLGFGDHGRD